MPDRPSEPTPPILSRVNLRDVVVLLILAAVLVAMRLHAFGLPLETDECNYAYIAGRLLEGDRLYVDVWDHQPPGIFVVFAGVAALFGNETATFRLFATTASLASMVLIFTIVRRQGGVVAGYLAAGLFALCSADPGIAGEGCNRELFMNPLALGAVWLLLRRSAPTMTGLLAAGLLLGLGSTIKTVLAAQWTVLALWIVVCTWKRHQPRAGVRRVLIDLGAFALGPALVWLATFGYFAATSRLTEFWEAAFAFNLGYSDVSASYGQRFIDFFRAPVHQYVFEGTWPIWLVAAVAAPALALRRRPERSVGRWALLCYLLGSYWAVCLPGQLWPHYYYLMLPPLILVVATLAGQFMMPRPHQAVRIGAAVASAIVVLAVLLAQIQTYLAVPTLLLTDKRYDSRDLWGWAQAQNVARVTEPGDTVLVYGHDVGIYYYSGRRCASRYTMVRALAEEYPGFEKRRAILLDEVKRHRPRVVLQLDDPFPALRQFLEDNYFRVGMDFHDRRPDEPIMLALMDKSRPVIQIDWNWHRWSMLP